MVNLKKIFERSGLRTCLIREDKIVDQYLLSEEEKERAENLIPSLNSLPMDFTYGFVEFKDGSRLGIVKSNDNFVVFPTRRDNVGELCRELAGGLIK